MDPTSAKDRAIRSIVGARAELDEALAELERVPIFDPGNVAFAAHALNNYLMVARATVDLLAASVADHPNAEVRGWLEGLGHATTLMSSVASQLLNNAEHGDPKLLIRQVDLGVLVARAAEFYQRIAERKRIRVHLEEAPAGVAVYTDRVAVAAVLDNSRTRSSSRGPRPRCASLCGSSRDGCCAVSRMKGRGSAPRIRRASSSGGPA